MDSMVDVEGLVKVTVVLTLDEIGRSIYALRKTAARHRELAYVERRLGGGNYADALFTRAADDQDLADWLWEQVIAQAKEGEPC